MGNKPLRFVIFFNTIFRHTRVLCYFHVLYQSTLTFVFSYSRIVAGFSVTQHSNATLSYLPQAFSQLFNPLYIHTRRCSRKQLQIRCFCSPHFHTLLLSYMIAFSLLFHAFSIHTRRTSHIRSHFHSLTVFSNVAVLESDHIFSASSLP